MSNFNDMYHYFVVVTKLPLTNAILLLLKSLSWHPSPFGGNGGFVASKIQRRISIDFSRHETDELCSKIPATMSQKFSRSCQLADSANRGITFATKLSAWNLWSEFWRFKKYSTSIVPSSFDHSLPSRIFSSKKSRVPVSISIDWLKDSLFWKIIIFSTCAVIAIFRPLIYQPNCLIHCMGYFYYFN